VTRPSPWYQAALQRTPVHCEPEGNALTAIRVGASTDLHGAADQSVGAAALPGITERTRLNGEDSPPCGEQRSACLGPLQVAGIEVLLGRGSWRG